MLKVSNHVSSASFRYKRKAKKEAIFLIALGTRLKSFNTLYEDETQTLQTFR